MVLSYYKPLRHAEQNKSDRERQILNDFTYIWNLKKCIYRAAVEKQT